MRRAAIVASAVLLVGCPIPQPLPDYPAGTITPPRILLDTVFPAPSEAVIRVSAGCDPNNEPSFELSAQLFDSNTLEQVVARWFVNYDPDVPATQTPIDEDQIVPANPDAFVFVRTLPDLPFGRGHGFCPYDYPPPVGTGTLTQAPYNEAGTIRVVELLVSNAFQPEPSTPKFRQPAQNFEVQLHRWVFLLVPGAADCGRHVLP